MNSKGIVMEQQKRYTIIMTSCGTFEKAKQIDGLIGEEVVFEKYEPFFMSFFNNKGKTMSFVLACVLFLLAIPTYFFTNGDEVYAFIHIDINPSVALEVDQHWNVHSIRSLNDDGLMIIDRLEHYKGEQADHVIQQLMEKSEQIGLLANGKNMLIGVSYLTEPNDVERFAHYLSDQLLTEKLEWEISTVYIPNEFREIALQEKRSMNELIASQIVAEDENEELPVNDADKKVIESFYENRQAEKSMNVDKVNVNEVKSSNQKNNSLEIKEKEINKHPEVSNERSKNKQKELKNNRQKHKKGPKVDPEKRSKRNDLQNQKKNNHKKNNQKSNNKHNKKHDKSNKNSNNGNAKGKSRGKPKDMHGREHGQKMKEQQGPKHKNNKNKKNHKNKRDQRK